MSLRLMRRSLPMLFVLLAVQSAIAGQITITLRPASENTRCTVGGFSVHVSDGTAQELLLHEPLAVTGGPVAVQVSVPDDGTDLTPVAKDCWTEAVSLVQNGDRVTADLWPASMVSGEVAPDRSSAPLRAIVGTFVDASVARNESKAIAEHHVACSLEGKAWRCSIPAGRPLHLKLAVDDFAPLHLWNLHAREAMVDTGIHPLVRGGTIVGRVVGDGRQPVEGAEVRLMAMTAAHQPAADRQLTALRSRSDAKGYFQFVGVTPGTYRLVSKATGIGDAIRDDVELGRGQDLRLDEPLTHAPMASLEVIVTPPMSTAQREWTIVLRRPSDMLSTMTRVAEGAVSAAGRWTHEDLQPGQYEVTVLDEGSEVARQLVELRGGADRLLLTVSTIDVHGRVVVGDEGVAGATVRFDFIDARGRRVEVTTDDEGRFRAAFPVAGEWQTALFLPPNGAQTHLPPVDIRSPHDEELLLTIPGGRIKGRVLGADGHPKPAAVLVKKDTRTAAHGLTDDEANFELFGLAAGSYTVEAEADDGFAGPLPVSVVEDEVTELDLIVSALHTVTGQILSADGLPASGAIVRFLDDITGSYEDVIADGRGVYSFKVKPAADFVDLVVFASPHPIAFRRIQVGSKGTVSAPPIQLQPVGSTVRVYLSRVPPPWPTIAGATGRPFGLNLLTPPRFGLSSRGGPGDGSTQLSLEPGAYVFCAPGNCVSKVLPRNTDTPVYFPVQAGGQVDDVRSVRPRPGSGGR
jgi:hypothetical protein